MEVKLNYPQRALESFKKLTQKIEFREIYIQLVEKVKSRKDSIERAQLTHDFIESYTDEVMNLGSVFELVTCRKGCSACCHTQVSVNSDEADLLAIRILEDGIRVDTKRLETQARVGNNSEMWLTLPYEERGCVFLDSNGTCMAYSDRPSVCRTNNVVSDPANCDTTHGDYQPIQLLRTDHADLATMAGFNASNEGGALPLMLVRAIARLNEKKLTKSMKKNYKKLSFRNLKELFKDSIL